MPFSLKPSDKYRLQRRYFTRVRASLVFADAVAEGSASAVDSPSATGTFNASVREGPVNFASFSEAFDNAAWTQSAVTVTADATTDPLGGSSADKIVPSTASTSQHRVQQTNTTEIVPNSVTMWGSVYAKAAGYNWLAIGLTDKVGNLTLAYFDVANGVTGTSGSTGTIQSVGNGWYRCLFSISTNVASSSGSIGMRFYVFNADSLASWSGNGTDGIYLWGAQRELGASATAYLPNYGAAPISSLDTVSSATASAAAVAEGSATSADTPSAAATLAASVAEAGSAADTTDASTGTARVGRVSWIRFFTPDGVLPRVGRVSWVRFFAPAGAGTIFSAAVAEGSATAIDTPQATGVLTATAAEGTATAADTPSALSTLNASVVEGSATATDTTNASLGAQTYAVSVVEGGATAIDTVDATGGAAVAPGYGGVWMYGLKYYKALRGELDKKEPEPEVVEAVAEVVKRTPAPEDDVAARLLLRLETEARGRAWQQIYLDTLEAYRAGYADYLDELRARDALAQHAMLVQRQLDGEAAAAAALADAAYAAHMAAVQLRKRRRLAAFLLLDL